jgi:hypothetical protein
MIVRLAVWLLLFHVGIDYWIFPNFFIDSNDIMDSFRPMQSFEIRKDDAKMYLLRIASAAAITYTIIICM